MPSAKVKRAIRAFEKAIRDKCDREYMGPYYSHDDLDRAGIDAINLVIEHNYVKARAKLERLMENL